jgi:cytoskeletal protein RodZ
VLYYVDELEIRHNEKTLPHFKDYAEYLALKGKKREENKREQQPPAEEKEKEKERPKDPKDPERKERIFLNLPRVTV